MPQEQEDGSPEVVLPDGSLGLREREDDWLQVAPLDVPQEQEQEREGGWPEVALPDGSPGLREHSALLRWQAAQQDAHSAPRRGSQDEWLPPEPAWTDSPARSVPC